MRVASDNRMAETIPGFCSLRDGCPWAFALRGASRRVVGACLVSMFGACLMVGARLGGSVGFLSRLFSLALFALSLGLGGRIDPLGFSAGDRCLFLHRAV